MKLGMLGSRSLALLVCAAGFSIALSQPEPPGGGNPGNEVNWTFETTVFQGADRVDVWEGPFPYQLNTYIRPWQDGRWWSGGVPLENIDFTNPIFSVVPPGEVPPPLVEMKAEGTIEVTMTWVGEGDPPSEVAVRVSSPLQAHYTGGGLVDPDNGLGQEMVITNLGFTPENGQVLHYDAIIHGDVIRVLIVDPVTGTAKLKIDKKVVGKGYHAWADAYGLTLTPDPRRVSIVEANSQWPLTAEVVNEAEVAAAPALSQDAANAKPYYRDTPLAPQHGTPNTTFTYVKKDPVLSTIYYGSTFTDYAQWDLGLHVFHVEAMKVDGWLYFDPPADIPFWYRTQVTGWNTEPPETFTWEDARVTYSDDGIVQFAPSGSRYFQVDYVAPYLMTGEIWDNLGGYLGKLDPVFEFKDLLLDEQLNITYNWNDGVSSNSVRDIVWHRNHEEILRTSEFWVDYNVGLGYGTYSMRDSVSGATVSNPIPDNIGIVDIVFQEVPNYDYVNTLIIEISLITLGLLDPSPFEEILTAALFNSVDFFASSSAAPDVYRQVHRDYAQSFETDSLYVEAAHADWTDPLALKELKDAYENSSSSFVWELSFRPTTKIHKRVYDNWFAYGFVGQDIGEDSSPYMLGSGAPYGFYQMKFYVDSGT